MEEKILIRIDFDSKAADKRAIELKKSIADVTQANKDLADSFKAGKITQDAYNKATYENDKAQKVMNTELKEIQRNIQLVDKFQKSQVGSNNDLKASILLLTDSYDKLSREERENEEIGGALQKQIKGLSDELKKSKAAIGDNRLEVGNYKQAITDAFKEVGLFNNIIDKAKSVQQGLTLAQSAAKDALKATKEGYKSAKAAISDVANSQDKLSTATTIAKNAFGGSINVLNLFKLALASTGIGLLVLAVGSLVTFLTSSQKGIDFLNTKLAGLKAIVSVVTTQLSNFGEMLFNAFDNPKKAIKDLIEAIGTNLLNRVKAFAVIWEAIRTLDFKKLNDGLIQLASGITDATNKTAAFAKSLNEARLAGESIERETIRIANEERKLNVERAQSKALVEQLKFIAEDTTKSTNECIKATKQAFDIEQKSANALIKLQKERIANIEKEQKLSNILNADKDKLAEERMKLAELVEGSTTRQIELNNKLNSLQAEAAAKAKALLEAQKKAQEEYITRTKEEYDEQVKNTAEFYDAQQAALLDSLRTGEINQKTFAEKSTQLRLEQLKRQLQDAKDYGRLSADLETKVAEEIYQIKQAQYEREFQAAVKATKREIDQKDGIQKDILEEVDKAYSERNLLISEKLLQGSINSFQAQSNQLESDKKFLERQLEVAKENGEDTTQIQQQLTDKLLEIKENERANIERIEAAKFEFARLSVAALGNILQIGAANASQAAEFQKQIALFQIGIDTAQAITSVVRVATSTSITPIDLAIKIAAGVATVTANILQAKALLEEEVPRPEFFEGGYTEKGDPREVATNLGPKPYTYHKAEYIMPAKVLGTPAGAALAQIAESMRVSSPNRYPNLPGLADGGFTARAVASSADNGADIIKGVLAAIANQNIYVKVTDIDRVSASKNANIAKATL